MSSNILGAASPKTNERTWRVIHCDDDGQGPCFKGKKRTLKNCIDELKAIWERERFILACVSDKMPYDDDGTEENKAP